LTALATDEASLDVQHIPTPGIATPLASGALASAVRKTSIVLRIPSVLRVLSCSGRSTPANRSKGRNDQEYSQHRTPPVDGFIFFLQDGHVMSCQTISGCDQSQAQMALTRISLSAIRPPRRPICRVDRACEPPHHGVRFARKVPP
jgi:hypothetical protein